MKHVTGRGCKCIQCNIKRSGVTSRRRRAVKKNPSVTVFRGNPAIAPYLGVAITYRLGHYTATMTRPGSGVIHLRATTERGMKSLIRQWVKVGATATSAAPRANPKRVRRNPAATRTAVVLSKRAYDLSYAHAEDGRKAYRHKFATGVSVQLLSDGSVRLVRPDGRPLWKNFPD